MITVSSNPKSNVVTITDWLRSNNYITNPQERLQKVNEFLAENSDPSPKTLETLADYLVFAIEKQERKREITTTNRAVTIAKRETSFEGLVSQLEGGEDGVYNLMSDNKNVILTPKLSISARDLQESQDLRQLRETIAVWEQKLKECAPNNKDRYRIKKMLIEMRRDQYLIKMSNRPPIIPKALTKTKTLTSLDGSIYLDPEDNVAATGFTFARSEICAQILQNYSRLRQDSSESLDADLWAMMQDFDTLSERALSDNPILLSVAIAKIDGKTNSEIRKLLRTDFQVEYTEEFISALWCRKIPNKIAEKAQDEWLDWYYLEKEKGKYKRCSKCGCNKLSLPHFFTRNRTSKDGLYSVCKECRQKARAAAKKVRLTIVEEVKQEENGGKTKHETQDIL